MKRSADGRKFGPAYAMQIRRRRPSHRDVWHLDEVMISIAGRKHWLWRAVDQANEKSGMPPKRIVTDKLRSYGAAKRDVMPAVEHRSHKGLNNRAEKSQLRFA
jgi:putative transposase